ncbi:hypothetical protein DW677_17585 [Clostridium sp. AM25-23AC]|nr:hypothetical protein DW677_17585 [Clostridium sp. AM25-23AC]
MRRRVLPAVHHYNGEKGAFWQTQRKFFYFPCLLPTTIRRCSLPKILKMGAKKAANLFQDLLLMCRCDERRY